ncbi:phasin family protein [Mesorhizobium sp. YR577]|uniref:phasin family protein n=1 Tax=Mesorhizobium sp. YR577 TaxID=1884373 RepID=UPI0008F24083|nr:phasin family protein [Mesorhizobium sp. YR577]SFU21385.1 Phasin protein [Mesorhizobium sp. YR577]
MPNQTATPLNNLLGPAAPSIATSQKALLAMGRLHAQNVKTMLHFQSEGLAFLKHRYEEEMKLVDDLMTTDGLIDAFVVYAGFFQNAVAEYSREAAKLNTIGSRAASETAKRVRREAEIVTEDMAARTAA